MALTKKIIKKLKSGTWYPFYNTFYEKTPVNTREILLVSRSGLALESNILAIFQELSQPDYRDFHIVLAVHKGHREAILRKLSHYGLKPDHSVLTGSVPY